MHSRCSSGISIITDSKSLKFQFCLFEICFKNSFDLFSQIVDKKVEPQAFNQEFIQRMLPRLEWQTIRLAADTLGFGEDLPNESHPEALSNDPELLQKLHHILLEIDILNGSLTCPETGRVFPISNGIPNFLLNEDEI